MKVRQFFNTIFDLILLNLLFFCLTRFIALIESNHYLKFIVDENLKIKFYIIIFSLILFFFLSIKANYFKLLSKYLNTLLKIETSFFFKFISLFIISLATLGLFYLSNLDSFYVYYRGYSLSTIFLLVIPSILIFIDRLSPQDIDKYLIEKVKGIFNKNTAKEEFYFPLDDNALDDCIDCDHNNQICDKIQWIINSSSKNRKYISIGINGSWGIGKTTIMSSLENNLKKKNYIVFWINLWQLKSPSDAILEIERQFDELFSNYYTESKNSLEFFRLATGLYNEKFSSLFNLFTKNEPESMNTARKKLQSKILFTLELAKKEKIIIIFDDLDRVLEKESVLFFLKTLTYIIGFDRVVSIAGVDLENLFKTLQPDYNKRIPRTFKNSIEELNDAHSKVFTNEEKSDQVINDEPSTIERREKSDFILKVFTLIIDLPKLINTSDIKNYAIKEFFNSDSSKCILIENFLKANKFPDKDVRDITSDISLFLNSEVFYELFINYRELKLILNEFLSKLLMMRDTSEKYLVTERISPVPLLIISTIKIINPCFYYELLNYSQEHSESNYNLDTYLTKLYKGIYFVDLPDNLNRILSLLLGIGIGIYQEKNLSTDISKNFEIRIRKSNLLLKNINDINVINFYINPVIDKNTFYYDSLESHFEMILKNTDKINILNELKTLFKGKSKFYKTSEINFETNSILNSFMFNYKTYVSKTYKIDTDFKVIFDKTLLVFNAIYQIVENSDNDKYFWDVIYYLKDLFKPDESFPVVYKKGYVTLIGSDSDRYSVLIKNIANLVYGESTLIDDIFYRNENQRLSLLYINLIPLSFFNTHSFLMSYEEKLNVFEIDREIYTKLKMLLKHKIAKETFYFNLSLIKYRIIIATNLNSITLNGKSLIDRTNKEIFIQYSKSVLDEYVNEIQILLNEYNSIIDKTLLFKIEKDFGLILSMLVKYNDNLYLNDKNIGILVELINKLDDNKVPIANIMKSILNLAQQLSAFPFSRSCEEPITNVTDLIAIIETYLKKKGYEISEKDRDSFSEAIDAFKKFDEKLKK